VAHQNLTFFLTILIREIHDLFGYNTINPPSKVWSLEGVFREVKKFFKNNHTSAPAASSPKHFDYVNIIVRRYCNFYHVLAIFCLPVNVSGQSFKFINFRYILIKKNMEYGLQIC